MNRLLDHPLILVTVTVGLVAVGHAVWIYRHRELGAFDPDEAGYLATAMRYQRSIDPAHPFEFIRSVGGTSNGVTVPLLSMLVLIVGPRSPQAAMLVQPLLMCVSAVAITGIALRVAPRGVAVGAGIAYCVFPTTILATQSYWYGLGAAAFTVLALWALVASDEGHNRWIWVFGACVAATLLTRTMTLGFIPGFVAAAFFVTYRSRRGLLRAGGALGLAALLAAPIYLVNRNAIFGYLFSYGYGGRAAKFGHGGPAERLRFRLGRIFDGMGVEPAHTVMVLGLIGLAYWVYRRRSHTASSGEDPPPREPRYPYQVAAALAAFVVLGVLALVSTTNNGVWFELPVIAVFTALLAAPIGVAPRLLKVASLAVILGCGAVTLPVAWWLAPAGHRGTAPIAVNYLTAAHYEAGFEQYDPRFGTDRRDELPEAAADWRSINDQVRHRLHELGTDPTDRPSIWMSGNFQLFNTNSVALSGEVAGEPVTMFVPDTVTEPEERADYLSPTFDGKRRVLVFALHRQHLFTPDEKVREFYRQARTAGWEPTSRFLLPGGGRVEVLELGRPKD